MGEPYDQWSKGVTGMIIHTNSGFVATLNFLIGLLWLRKIGDVAILLGLLALQAYIRMFPPRPRLGATTWGRAVRR
jgi:hypothetical protein